MKTGLLVAFPGTGYTCGEPLFASCIEKYRRRGYDTLCLDFSAIPFKEIATLEEAVERAKAAVLAQTAALCPGEYADVVFLSKSLGTGLAVWLAGRLARPVRQFFLTPVNQALAPQSGNGNIIGMVIGTEDRVLDYETVQDYCKARAIPCLVVPGVGHNLKTNDAETTAAIDRQIVEMC